MQSLRRKAFGTAVLAALGAMGELDSANAVHVNPAGLGQALIYPYYTTRSGAGGGRFNTYLSVVNTTPATKAIKVRFLEGKNGRPVMDINAYLSPLDIWTAAVIPDANSIGSQLITSDNSCVVSNLKGMPFVNYAFTGSAADGETDGLDRANEGYFEILELGELIGTITTGLKHNASGVPVNCAVLGGTPTALNEANVVVTGANANVVAGHGGLTGTATLINPTTGAAFSYEPTVLDDWNYTSSTWTSSGSITPDLSFSSPAISKVFDGNRTVITDWTTSPNAYDAVSAALMHDKVINEYMMDAPTLSRTEWIVTFPTKRGYVGKDKLDTYPNIGTRQYTAAIRPFQSNFWTGGACDKFLDAVHDREEDLLIYTVGVPPPGWDPRLCWAANVIPYVPWGIARSDILNSTNKVIAYSQSALSATTAVGNGWTELSFFSRVTAPTLHQMWAPVSATTIITSVGGVATAQTVDATYFGLPAVGFAIQSYTNTAAGGSMFGARFNHKYTRSIRP